MKINVFDNFAAHFFNLKTQNQLAPTKFVPSSDITNWNTDMAYLYDDSSGKTDIKETKFQFFLF